MMLRKILTGLLILLGFLLSACASNAPTPATLIEELPAISESAQPSVTQDASGSQETQIEDRPATDVQKRNATITSVINEALARALKTDTFILAEPGMVLLTGGELQTKMDSRASLSLLPEGIIVRVGPNTIFTVQEIDTEEQPGIRLHLDIGKIWILLRGGTLEVETPSGVAAVRGSLLGVSYDPEEKQVTSTCLEGNCGFTS